jgi:ATP-dependent exoDNAse (exonuclease V) beta subunit
MNEPVPFIYERLGEKYHHLMIDEFQDTSVLQWQNLLPLFENSLAYGYFNMVVGDGKQAIYRWRNGDVGQLTSLPSIAGSKRNPVLAARENILRDQFDVRELDSNFRSKAEIVDFNNHFFAHLRSLMSESNQLVYKHLEQKYDSENTGGFISIEFLEKEAETMSYKGNTFPRILEIIKELTSDQFQRKDIAILCRRNRDSSEIARFLAENDIDVISSESLLLSQSPEVNFMVAFLRLFDDPFNIIVKAEVITFLHAKRKLPESNLDELLGSITSRSSKRDNLFATLKRYGFNLSPGELGMMLLVDFFEEIIRVFSLNIPANPYIQFFLDYVLKFSRKNTASRTGFLEWWDDHKDSLSVIVPRGMDAVNIMTVHKAKGLQFPVVILPHYPEKKMLTKPYLWVELSGEKFNGLSSCMLATGKEMGKTAFAEQYEEEEEKSLLDIINILYVGMTRPEERLYIISPVPPVKSANLRSVPEFFKHFLMSENRWSDQFMKYEWGTRSIHQSKTIKETPETITLAKFISSDWREKVFLRLSAPESWDVMDPQRSRKWGNLVHTALSKINTRDDCGRVLEEMNLSGLIEESQKEQLSEKIHALLTDPEVSRFFQQGLSVKTETEILVRDGSVYRPDRVILEGEKAIILDYKTGKPKEHYKKQLQTYGKLIREMGFKKIQSFLLYIDPEVKLVEVKNEE